jgi:hypothetical protein
MIRRRGRMGAGGTQAPARRGPGHTRLTQGAIPGQETAIHPAEPSCLDPHPLAPSLHRLTAAGGWAGVYGRGVACAPRPAGAVWAEDRCLAEEKAPNTYTNPPSGTELPPKPAGIPPRTALTRPADVWLGFSPVVPGSAVDPGALQYPN